MHPVITFIVPVYRVEDCLDRCVQSLLCQRGVPVELLLVDDGSPDNCPALCDGYAGKDARVRVLHQENQGLSAARNAGMAAARGTYLCFVDADDYLSPDTCEKLLPFLGLSCDILAVDGVSEGRVKKLTHRGRLPGQICTGPDFLKACLAAGSMPMAAWLALYRRDFLRKQGLWFPFGRLHEDEAFTPRAFLAARRVVNTGVCCYHYVWREGSITAQNNRCKHAADLYRTCLELLPVYEALPDRTLRRLLVDSLAVKLLSLWQEGKLWQYGAGFAHKSFLWKCARRPKTRMKVLLFWLSPRGYWYINNGIKRMRVND